MTSPVSILRRMAQTGTLLAALTGCSTHLFSLPGRTVPLESAEVLAAGRKSVSVEGSGGSLVFGPAIYTASARLRLGMDNAKGYELDVEANGMLASEHVALGARAGTKVRIWEFLSLTTGVGAGGSSMGGYVSPDLGFLMSYENADFIPFGGARVWVSAPFAKDTLYLSDNGESDGTIRPYEAGFTFGTAFTAGARIPITRDRWGERWSLALGAQYQYFNNLETGKADGLLSFALNSEWRF